MDKQGVIKYLEERAEDFYALSDKIWGNAEIRFQEKESVNDYVAFLEKEGFSVEVGLAGLKTSFKAVWGSGKPVIGFLGEYDALPGLSQKAGVAVKEAIDGNGNGHGCGHNLLGVGALMGAVGYKHYLETEGKEGTVIYFGCPAEEGGSGKTFMAREGCFDDLDCALSWHPADLNMMPPGPVLANDSIRYSFTGKSSHAAAAPEKGRSALDALELMNIGVQFLREHMPSNARIHYAITDTGGISPNIVQAHASALYQIRAPYAPELASLYERVNNIAKGAALMTDTEVEIKFLKGTSNTLLIPALDELMYKNMCEIHNPVEDASDMDFAFDIVKTQKDPNTIGDSAFNIKPMPWNKAGNMPLPGSSDVGDVSWVCPVTQCGTSTWPKGTAAHSWQAVACGKSDFAHRGMLFAGEIIAATAFDIFNNPEVITLAWEQHREKTGNQTYHCPIPKEISPSELEAETT